MPVRTFIIFVTLSFYQSGFAQKEINNWYFGNKVGITFNTKPPTALTNGQLITDEGCASISTPSGRLLFYTDGMTVWDSFHNVMPNGTGLKGGVSSTQSALIIPRPDSAHIFYIFTVATQAGTDGLQYSEVNMQLNSGKGDIVSNKRNIKLKTSVCEKLTAILHANRHDYWILVAKFGGDSLFAYSVTGSGVSYTPVGSKTGLVIKNSNTGNTIGQIKISPDGKKVAYANYFLDTSALGDFDVFSGKISNIWKFYLDDGYGVEFSPNNRLLYFTDGSNVAQYNANASSRTAFIASRKVVDSIYGTAGIPSALQIGPDGKIYIAMKLGFYTSVIHAPDSSGFGCNPQKNYIHLSSTKKSNAGLPGFVQSLIRTKGFTVSRNCINDSTFFTISDLNNVDSVKWNFDDPGSGSNNSSKKMSGISHIYKNTGYYNVTLVSYIRIYTDTTRLKFYVKDSKPQLGRDTTICNMFNLVFKPQKSYLTYLWNNNSTASSISVSQKGTFVLKAKDTAGCITSDTIVVHNPQALVGLKLSDTLLCLAQNNLKLKDTSEFIDDTRLKSTFYFGDGTSKVDTIARKSYSTVGSYIVKLVVESKLKCKDSFSQKVTVSQSASLSYNINKTGQCLKGNSFNFTNASTITTDTISRYKWLFGDDSSSASKDITGKVYLKDSLFRVSLITVTNKNCYDTLTKLISVYPNTKVDYAISRPVQCFKQQAFDILNLSSIRTGVVSTYQWNFGDNQGSTSKNIISKKYNTADSFVISLLTITDKGCRDSLSKKVYVYPSSNVAFSIDKNTQCFKWNNFNFTNSSSIPVGNIKYNWSFGDGTNDTGYHVSNKKYGSFGTYDVKLITISEKNCRDTVIKKLTVNASPVSSFSVNKDRQCFKGNSFNLTNTTTINNGTVPFQNWNLGDGKSFTSQNISNYSYITEDTFIVKLISSSDKGCFDTVSHMLVTFAQPVARYIVPNDSQCWQKNYFNIINQSTLKYGIMNHTWNFGDYTYDYAYTPVTKKFANTSAKYTIRYNIISDNGCSDSMFHKINLFERPIADISINDSVQCFKNHLFSFSNKTTFSVMNTLTYYWDYGNGNQSTGATPQTAVYTSTGYHSLQLVAYSSLTNCYDTLIQKVLVAPHAKPGFTINRDSQCMRFNDFGFMDSSILEFGQMKYQWDFTDGNTSALQNPSHHYNLPTNYKVKLLVTTNNDCKDSTEGKVIVMPNPKANFTINDTSQCINNQLFDLTNITSLNSGSFSSYWIFDEGSNSTGKNIRSKQFDSLGIHQIILTVNSDFNCTDTITKNINVLESPKAIFSLNDSVQCLANNLLKLIISSTANNPGILEHHIAWGDNANDNLTGNGNLNHNYSKDGTYYVSLICEGGNTCADTTSQQVIVLPMTIVKLSVNGFCLGDTTFASVPPAPGNRYHWQINNVTLQDTNSSIKKVLPNTGLNKIGVSVPTLECAGMDSVNINILEKPKADFSYVRLEEANDGFPYHFTDQSYKANTWLWQFGNNGISNNQNPDHLFKDTGYTWIRLIVSNQNICYDSMEKKIQILDRIQFFFPNAFSPNGNSINDGFGLDPSQYYLVKEYKLEIFNRWGEKVFKSENVREQWIVPDSYQQGVYMFKALVKDLYGTEREISGAVEVLR